MRPLLFLSLMIGATFPELEDFRKRVSTGGDLSAEATAISLKNKDLQVGRCLIHFEDGSALPIKAGHGETEMTAGFIFQGEGTLTVDFAERADAWNFANHMVLTADKDPAEMAAIAHQEEPYKVAIGRGIVISARDEALQLMLPEMSEEDAEYMEDLAYTADFTMVVEDRRDHTVRAIAAGATVPNRLSQMQFGGMDLRPRISDELLQRSWGGIEQDQRLLFADFITDDTFNVAAGGYRRETTVRAEDRWMSCLEDPRGVFNRGEMSQVFIHGREGDGMYHRLRVTGDGFPVEDREFKDVPGVRKRDLVPVKAELDIDAEPVKMRKHIAFDIDSTITVRATRDGVQRMALSLPVGQSQPRTFKIDALTDAEGNELPWASMGDQTFGDPQGSASVASADMTGTVDDAGEAVDIPGTATLGGEGGGAGGAGDIDTSASADFTVELDPELRKLNPDRDWIRYDILVLLPEPLREGEEFVFQLDWSGEWSQIQASDNPATGAIGRVDHPTTGFRDILPEFYPVGNPTRWTYTATVTIPELNGFDAAVSGMASRSWRDQDQETLTWLIRGNDLVQPGIAFGKWNSHEEMVIGFPAIQIHVHPVDSYALEIFGPQLRSVLQFYGKLMPQLREKEWDIYTGPNQSGQWWGGNAGDTMLELNRYSGTNAMVYNLDPYSGHTILAREVGRKYWNGLVMPGGEREAWIGTVMPDVYAAFYVRAVLGTQDYFLWMEKLRGVVEDSKRGADRVIEQDRENRKPVDLMGSRTGTRQMRHYYGMYIMGNSLRYTVGEELYYASLDAFMRTRKGEYVTTALIQETFEETSGQDLSDFFDFWVRGGRIPEITIETNTVDGVTRGCISSDIPFGNFQLPVTIIDRDGFGQAAALVDVIDGEGSFEVPGRKGEVEVQVDPDGLVPLREREVKVEDELSCF